jgi:Tfp pilus assembly protein PilN
MRPVNLIPKEERRDKASIRSGPVAYLLVGALALALGAVTLVVLTNNKIADRKTTISQLKQQEAAAKARSDALAPFASFNSMEEQRTATIQSLADSRFDWERVMRELARVIPSDVWLTDLSGAVTGAASTSSSGSGSSSSSSSTSATSSSIDTSSVTGPILHISGCARGQDGVAAFLSALRDIDGVTRVGLASSALASGGADAASSGSSGGSDSSSGCATRKFIAQFDIVAAFDNVPAPAIPEAAPTAPATAPTDSSGSTTTASSTTGTTG